MRHRESKLSGQLTHANLWDQSSYRQSSIDCRTFLSTIDDVIKPKILSSRVPDKRTRAAWDAGKRGWFSSSRRPRSTSSFSIRAYLHSVGPYFASCLKIASSSYRENLFWRETYFVDRAKPLLWTFTWTWLNLIWHEFNSPLEVFPKFITLVINRNFRKLKKKKKNCIHRYFTSS